MYWRIVLSLCIAVFFAGTHWKAYVEGQKKIREEFLVKAAALEHEYRSKEHRLVRAKQKVEVQYEALKKANAQSAAGARTELDRLRQQLASDRPAPTSGSAASARVDGASIEGELLGASAAALVAVAAEADRLAAQVVGLQKYVGSVCLAR